MSIPILTWSLILLLVWAGSVLTRAEGDWEGGFRSPPPECRPEVFCD